MRLNLMAYLMAYVLNKIKDKSITGNIFGIKDNEAIKWRFYCMVFIGYMLSGKNVLDYTNLFSASDYKKKKRQNNV